MPSTRSILRVHVAGDWPRAAVSTAWVPSTHIAPPHLHQSIEGHWQRATAEPGRHLFDGPMCRLESWDVSKGGVRFAMSRTSYKIFWGTNLTQPELADQYGAAVLANPVGLSPALETADGFLLLGRRNAAVAYYPSRVHPFAGCLEPGDGSGRDGTGPDLFTAVQRELEEELGLHLTEIDLIHLTGVVEDVRLRQPELIFRVKSRLQRGEIEARLDPAEHDASLAIQASPAAIAGAVADAALTPVAVGSLLLWGKLAFGEAWFEQHRP